MCARMPRRGRIIFPPVRLRIRRRRWIFTAEFMPFDVAAVRARFPERRIEWYGSVNSTMTLAARAARDGAPSGTVIGADGQVAGVGRHGHTWHSEAEAGLYVSMVLRLPIDASGLPVVMLALGIATQ